MVIPLLPGIYAAINGALGWPVFAALNSNYSAEVNGNASLTLVYLGGIATVVLAALLVWLVIVEIGRAQRHAGIEPDGSATLRDVFLAKVGVGVESWQPPVGEGGLRTAGQGVMPCTAVGSAIGASSSATPNSVGP